MKKLATVGAILTLLLVVGAAVQPAHASCGLFARLMVSENYIFTPGICGPATDYPCGDHSSVSPALKGTFWHVGNGNPTLVLGNDNGAFTALDNWIHAGAGYPATMGTTWAASQLIDGCPDNPQGGPAAKCVAVLLEDVDVDGNPVFALLAQPADVSSNYHYDYGEGVPINLAPLPKAQVVNSVRGVGSVALTIAVPAGPLDAGLFLNATSHCAGVGGGATTLIAGYRARYLTQPRGTPPPTGDETSGWTDCLGGVIPLGQSAACNVPCVGDVDAYTSYSLVLDSGFEMGIVGPPSTRAECGSTLADPAPKIQIRQGSRSTVRTR